MKNDASAIGFIGIPEDENIKMLEKELGMPIKKIEKKERLFCWLEKDYLKVEKVNFRL